MACIITYKGRQYTEEQFAEVIKTKPSDLIPTIQHSKSLQEHFWNLIEYSEQFYKANKKDFEKIGTNKSLLELMIKTRNYEPTKKDFIDYEKKQIELRREVSPMYNLEADNREVSEESLFKIKNFLKKAGISLEMVESIVINGKKVSANAVANIYKGLIQILNGKEAGVIAEETFHFVVKVLSRENPQLYKTLLDKASTHPIYKEVLEKYRNNPEYLREDIDPITGDRILVTDFDKIREEAAGQLLDKILKNRDNRKPATTKTIKSLWASIIEAIKSWFNKVKSPVVSLDEFEQVIDMVLKGDENLAQGIAKMLSERDDFSQGIEYFFSLEDAYATDTQRYTANLSVKDFKNVQSELVKQLKDTNNSVVLDETDINNTFYKSKSGKVLKRSTEVINEVFMSKERMAAVEGKKVGYFDALKQFEKVHNRKYDPDKDALTPITYDGKTFTFEELTDLISLKIMTLAKTGTIVHLLLEKHNTKDAAKKAAIDKQIDDLKDKIKAVMGADYNYSLGRWFTDDVINELYGHLGINLSSDEVLSETTMYSDLLEIGATADMVIVKPNGNKQIIDLKTGAGFLSDQIYRNVMKYSDTTGKRPMFDTKLSRANLQIVMLMLLDKMASPDSKYEPSYIYHIHEKILRQGRAGAQNLYAVDLDVTLKMIENWIKETNPDAYEQLKKVKSPTTGKIINMFNPNEYRAIESDYDVFRNRAAGIGISNSVEDYGNSILEEINQEINKERMKGGLSNLSQDRQKELLKKLDSVNRILLNEKQSSLYGNFNDLGAAYSIISDRYLLAGQNPILKFFIRMQDRALIDYKKELEVVTVRVNRLVKNLIQEKNYSTSQGSIDFHTNSNSGLYDFMFEKKVHRDIEGYYRKTLKKEDVGKTITKAQWEFYEYFVNTIDKYHEEVLGTVAYYEKRGGKSHGVTKGELLEMDLEDPTFLPRVPAPRSQLLKLKGAKEILNLTIVDIQNRFINERKQMNNKGFGVPVKFAGSDRIVAEQMYDFNMENALLNHVSNLIYKKYQDPVDAIAISLNVVFSNSLYPRSDGSIKSLYENTLKVIDVQNRLVTLNREDEVDTQGEYSMGGKKVSVQNIGGVINRGVTTAALGLNIAGSTANLIQQTSLTLKQSIAYSIAKKIAGDDLDYGYGIKLVMKAAGIFGSEKMYLDGIKTLWNSDRTEIRKSKLYYFTRLLSYSTNERLGQVGAEALQAVENRASTKDMTYILQEFSESGSLYTTMVASLLATKVRLGDGTYIRIESNGSFTKLGKDAKAKQEATSMWDAYKFDDKDGVFKYIGPTRGSRDLTGQREITGLTYEEIGRLWKESSKIYGNYRAFERNLLDAHWITKYFMKFKRYIPNVYLSFFNGTYDDFYQGEWSMDNITYDAKGNPVMNWEAMRSTGMLLLATKSLLALTASFTPYLKNHPNIERYKWSNLSKLEKQQLILFMVHLLSLIAFATAGGMLFDDDDEDAKIAQRWERLTQDQIGIYPFDIVNTLNTPLPQLTFMKNLMQAYSDMFLSGIGIKERVKAGANKGDLRGWSTARRKTPILNILTQFGIFEDESNEPTDNWLYNFLSWR